MWSHIKNWQPSDFLWSISKLISIYDEIWASRWVSLDVCTRMSDVYFTLRLPRGNARWKNEEKKFTEFCHFPILSWRTQFYLANQILTWRYFLFYHRFCHPEFSPKISLRVSIATKKITRPFQCVCDRGNISGQVLSMTSKYTKVSMHLNLSLSSFDYFLH